MNDRQAYYDDFAPQEICRGCPRRCPLEAPACEKGRRVSALPPAERAADFAAREHGGPLMEDARPDGPHPGPHGPHDPHHGPGPHEMPGHHGPHGPGPHGPGPAPHEMHGPHGPHYGPGPHGPGPAPHEMHGPHGPGPHGPRELPRPEFLDDPESLNGLMHRCVHALRRRSDRDRGQRSVLALLAAWGETDQRTLQETLGIQPGSISELLAKLEGKGYITKTRSAQDRRMAAITLTEEGRQAARALPDKKQDLYSALTEQEQETLKTLLKKLLDSWQ